MSDKNNLDKENLRQAILETPFQLPAGLKLAKNIKIPGDFDKLVVSGMGGSSLPADVLRTYFASLDDKSFRKGRRLAIIQNRTYSLPKESSQQALNLFISYSGNTEETIASLNEAVRKKLPSIGFASGGKLVEICKKNRIPCVMMPDDVIQPRYATGYFFSAILQVLQNSGLIKIDTEKLSGLSKKLAKEIAKMEPEGKKIAKKLTGKTPVIYASDKFLSLALIFKIKINENAKTPAFYNVFPELNHNEMVGFTLPQGKFHILTFLDSQDHPQNLKRMKITAKLYKEKGVTTDFIKIRGNEIVESLFFGLALGDWISYYLALEYGQDPAPVKMVEDLKKKLA